MRIELDIRKSIPENAAYYYEQAKKARRKMEGLKKAIEKTRRDLERTKETKRERRREILKRREKDWYEKFHWFFSSDGFLVLGGRDARSNQILVRRYMEPRDLFFHADIKGGSVVIVKSQGREIPERTKKEAAEFAASFSKAFSLGLAGIDVYSVKPEQVKTAAKAGEYLPRGGFVIIGEREWYRAMPTRIAVSYDKDKHRVISGPEGAIPDPKIILVPGDVDKGRIAKEIARFIEENFGEAPDLDDIVRMIPPGKARIIQPRD